MNIYIAGSSSPEGIAKYRVLAALVLAEGHTIAHDWTIDVEESRARGLADDVSLSPERRSLLAENDFAGVMRADVLMYIAPDKKSEGSAYEMGAHHMKRDLIKFLMVSYPLLEAVLPVASIVIGNAASIFVTRCDYQVATNEEAMKVLSDIVKSDRTAEVLTARALAKANIF